MSRQAEDWSERAGEYWRGGRPLEAGRLIVENLPSKVRPEWASNILRLVLGKSGIKFPAIEHLLHMADQATEWENAHRAFSTLRKSTLELEGLPARSRDQ